MEEDQDTGGRDETMCKKCRNTIIMSVSLRSLFSKLSFRPKSTVHKEFPYILLTFITDKKPMTKKQADKETYYRNLTKSGQGT